jgi:hypothetical protein
MLDQAAEIRRQITALTYDEDDPNLRAMDSLERGLRRLHSVGEMTVAQWSEELDSELLGKLDQIATILGNRRPEPLLEPKTLQDVRTKLQKLIEEVADSDELDDATRRYVIQSLVNVRRALDDYGLVGALGVEKAFNEMVGAFGRQGILQRIRDTSLGERVTVVLTAIGTALTLVSTVKAIEPAPVQPPPVVINQIFEQQRAPSSRSSNKEVPPTDAELLEDQVGSAG